jgi:hypothetical protein
MRKTYSLMLVGMMALAPITRAVDRVVTTTTPTGAGSLTEAINALVDGDRITFNIAPLDGSVKYIDTPFDGYPLITNNNITIDGYTQNGASANTASIHSPNNAALKIVLRSIDGNGVSMKQACETVAGITYGGDFGFGNGEIATLGFFRASNAWVKGICFLVAPGATTTYSVGNSKSICFATDAPDVGSNNCQNFHVSGCWWGVDPVTKLVAYMPNNTTVLTPDYAIATYGSGPNAGSLPNSMPGPGTLGVGANSTNPRAEFNIFVTGYGFDSQGFSQRVSGNFWGVLPDGTTAADMSVLNGGTQHGDGFVEWGGTVHDNVVGTDGDGVNDADEANIFGPWANGGIDIYFYSGMRSNLVFAGNNFNCDINGKSFGKGTNANWIMHKFSESSIVRLGSDFNGVSDALEFNRIADMGLFEINTLTGYTTNLYYLSMRGNILTNTIGGNQTGSLRPPVGDGQDPANGLNLYNKFIDTTGGNLPIIPVISTASATSLQGTCGLPLNQPWNVYTNLMVDLYEASPDVVPQGMRWIASFKDNSAADGNAAVGAFTFNTTGLGITSSTKLVITVTYSKDTAPTIASVSRSGSQVTVNVNNPGVATYGIQKSAALSPTSWSAAGVAVGGTATFTDSSNPLSVYRAQAPTATGQTSPFSNVYTVP